MVTKASLCVSRTISFHSVSAHGDCIRRTRLSYFLNQVPPITVQKTNVREEDITVRGRNVFKRLCFVARRQDDMAEGLEINPEGF